MENRNEVWEIEGRHESVNLKLGSLVKHKDIYVNQYFMVISHKPINGDN